MICPSVDYRQFRLRKLNTPGFSHVWLLLFWPVFGLLFSYAERFYPVAHYFEMHCALDDLICFFIGLLHNFMLVNQFLRLFGCRSNHGFRLRLCVCDDCFLVA